MESLGVVKEVGLGRIQGRLLCATDSLAFKHVKEVFVGRLVGAVPNGAHRAQQRLAIQTEQTPFPKLPSSMVRASNTCRRALRRGVGPKE